MLGREVRSLVARGDRARWPEPWPGPGLTWTGALRFEVAEVSVTLVMEMVGMVSGEGWAIRLAVPSGGALPEFASSVMPVPSDAPLAAADGLDDADEAPAATRGVLQALDASMPFDFACVLRFVGGGALVVATYPTAMAGVASGDAWSRLDEAEVGVRERGEPTSASGAANKGNERKNEQRSGQKQGEGAAEMEDGGPSVARRKGSFDAGIT